MPSIQVTSSAGFHSGFAPRMDAARWVQVDLGEDYTIDSVVVVPASINGAGAYEFPNKFRIETSRDALLSEPELLVETTVEDPSSILPYFVTPPPMCPRVTKCRPRVRVAYKKALFC